MYIGYSKLIVTCFRSLHTQLVNLAMPAVAELQAFPNQLVFGLIFIRCTQSQNMGKPNNIKIIGNNETSWPKNDVLNQLRSPMIEEREH
jgi:hypothetical protein